MSPSDRARIVPRLASEPPSDVELEPSDHFLLSVIDGHLDITELCQRLRGDPERTIERIQRLAELGFLRLSREGQAPAIRLHSQRPRQIREHGFHAPDEADGEAHVEKPTSGLRALLSSAPAAPARSSDDRSRGAQKSKSTGPSES